jgi:hypothetical protein
LKLLSDGADRQLIVQHGEFLTTASTSWSRRATATAIGRVARVAGGAAWDDDTTVNDHDDVVAVGGPQTSTM